MKAKEQNINPWYFRQVVMAIFLILAMMLIYVGFSQLFAFDSYTFLYMTVSQVVFYVASLLAVFYFVIFKKRNTMAQFFGTKDFGKQLLRGFLVFLVIIFVTTFIDRLCEYCFSVKSSDVYGNVDKQVLLTLAFVGVFFAPLAEEVFFRGFMQPVFVERFGKIFGIALVCSMFSLMHVLYVDNISAFLSIVSVGLILSLSKEVTKSLIPCVFAHFLNNLLAVWVMFYN